MNLKAKIAILPFLRITPVMVLGIVAAQYFDVPQGITALCGVVCYILGWMLLSGNVGWIYVGAAIFFSSMLLAQIRIPAPELPQKEYITLCVKPVDMPVHAAGRWWRTNGVVERYRRSGKEHRWQSANENIQLYIDTAYSVEMSRSMIVRGYLNPIDTTTSSYGDLMRARGYHSRMYITKGNVLAVSTKDERTLLTYAKILQNAAAERIERLGLTPDSQGVAIAMSVGQRHDMSGDLRKDYSRVGAAHLLAVSGLHVGIVFLLVNLLLYWLPAFGRGHLIRGAVAVAVIWAYALVSGMSPSVMRAALMFSAVQLAVGVGGGRSALNVMLGSAALLLCVNPNYLFDMSFQLSYAAVLSIFCFFNPLYGLVRSRFVALNLLSSVTVVGIAATLGTAPLVAYYFGNFPFAGIVINPVVIASAHVIIFGSLVWTIAPLVILQPIVRAIVECAAWVQNSVVGWSAGQSWAAAEVELGVWGVVGCYVILITAAVIINMREPKKELSLQL